MIYHPYRVLTSHSGIPFNGIFTMESQLEFTNFVLTNVFEEPAYKQIIHSLVHQIFCLILSCENCVMQNYLDETRTKKTNSKSNSLWLAHVFLFPYLTVVSKTLKSFFDQVQHYTFQSKKINISDVTEPILENCFPLLPVGKNL